MSSKTVKIQMVTDHQDYKKGQIIELEEKFAISLLTNGKALNIHRKTSEITEEKTEEKLTETRKSKK